MSCPPSTIIGTSTGSSRSAAFCLSPVASPTSMPRAGLTRQIIGPGVADAALRSEIRLGMEANFRVYGVRKVCGSCAGGGGSCPLHDRAADAADGVGGAIRGRAVKTTVSDRAAPSPLDRVNWQFRAAKPNALWVADFTYVATWQGLRLRRLHHRRLRAAHHRLARIPLGTNRFCARCPGAGPRRPPPCPAGPSAS